MTIEFVGGPLDGTRREYPPLRWPPAVIRMAAYGKVHRYRYGGPTAEGVLIFNYEGVV